MNLRHLACALFLLATLVAGNAFATDAPASPALAKPVPALGQVDERYPFTLEATGLAGLFANIGTVSSSQFVFGGGLTFAGPVGEGRQVAGGVMGATSVSNSGSARYVLGWAGYRILTFLGQWRTRFDLDGAADYAWFSVKGIPGVSSATRSGFGLGGHVALSVEYYFFPSFGIGPQADLSVLGITFQVIASLAAEITFNW